jgi:hypothetical protein
MKNITQVFTSFSVMLLKNDVYARHQWLMSVILATWKAKIGRIEV